MKLLTLSKFTDITESLPSNNHTDSQDIFTYNQFLKEPIQLKHFIACGKDGLPMSEPMQVAHDTHYAEYDKEEVAAYKKALQDITFEGWEVENDEDEEVGFYSINNGTYYLQFDTITGLILYSNNNYKDYKYIENYNHLAHQTINNPIPFHSNNNTTK